MWRRDESECKSTFVSVTTISDNEVTLLLDYLSTESTLRPSLIAAFATKTARDIGTTLSSFSSRRNETTDGGGGGEGRNYHEILLIQTR